MRAGTLLDGRFDVRSLVGVGGMSEVWIAMDRRTGLEVAVKTPLPTVAALPQLVRRFEQEVCIARALDDEHVCRLVASGRTREGAPYMVLERLVGEALSETLDRENELPLAEAAWIADDVLQALACAHRAGVVHRDLKPGNVFLATDGDGGRRAKVLDFGVSKVLGVEPGDKGVRTATDATLGTLLYVAPEQLGGAADVAPSADLYALGTILFRVLSGRLPFAVHSEDAFVAMKREYDAPGLDEVTGEQWPSGVVRFVRKCTTRSPARRFESGAVALAAWRKAVAPWLASAGTLSAR